MSDSSGPENPPPTGGTAAQVAQMAGVSIFTVSRAFSGSDTVSVKTRERVLAVAKTLGYSPNFAGRALRTGKVATVALVQPARVMSGEFYSDILAGLQSSLEGRDLGILLSSVPEGSTVESWVHSLVYTGRCSAVGLLMSNFGPETLTKLESLSFPVVLLNCVLDNSVGRELSAIGFDNTAGVQQAVRHLHEIGHRRIAFFRCPSVWDDTLRREEGFRSGMADMGLELNEEWIVTCFVGPQSGVEAFDQLFSQSGEKPTAIICSTDDIALGVLCAAERWGKHIPDQLSVVGHDDNTWTAYHTPSLTTIRHKGFDLGQKAGEMLLRRYDNPALPCERLMLPTQLIVRHSTARPKRVQL